MVEKVQPPIKPRATPKDASINSLDGFFGGGGGGALRRGTCEMRGSWLGRMLGGNGGGEVEWGPGGIGSSPACSTNQRASSRLSGRRSWLRTPRSRASA